MPDGDISLVVADAASGSGELADSWLGAALRIASEHSGRVAVRLPPEASASDVEALTAAGADILHVELLGKNAEEHDYHAGLDGAFALLNGLLEGARFLPCELVATTPVTRSNFRSLREFVPLLRRSRVRAWRVACLRVDGRIRDAEQRIVPRIGMSLPHVLHATKLARDAGIEVFVEGAPLCAMGPFAGHRFWAHEQGGYGERCSGCEARSACGGAHPRYLERFGDGELRPREAPPALMRSDARDRYASVFAWAGGQLS